MRKLICAMVTILLLGASLTTLSGTAEAATTHDRKRRDRVSVVIDGLEAYAQANGTFRVAGAGNNGHGWFSLDGTTKYQVSIADALVDAGMLADPVREEPTLADRHQDGFYIKVCDDRIGVFSLSDGMETFSGDEAWWAANGCSRWAIDNQNHVYFQVSKPLSELSLSDDQLRAAAVDEVLAALDAYEADYGTYAVNAGNNNNGRGWFSREGEDAPGEISIAAKLVELNYLNASDIPEDPNVRYSYKRGLLVYQCEDRVGVFSETDGTIAASADDAAWWDANNCNRYPLDNRNHQYFVLSEAEPILQVPEWESSSALALESLSPYDFTVSWCCTFASPATDIFELSITDSAGITQVEYIDPADPWQFRVGAFSGYAPAPGETFSLSMVAVNAAGSSDPLTLSLGVPTLSVTTISEQIEGESIGSPAQSRAADGGEPSDVELFTFAGECAKLTTTVLFGFGDTIGMTVTDSDGNVSHHEFPIYVGENIAATFACHDGTNITTNDLLPISCDEYGPKDVLLTSSASDQIGGAKGAPNAANFFGCDISATGLLDWLPFVEYDLEDSIVHTINVNDGVLTILREHFLVR